MILTTVLRKICVPWDVLLQLDHRWRLCDLSRWISWDDVTVSGCHGQVESYLSILFFNQDVKIIFYGSRRVWRILVK